jgi:hypothetical protein
MKSLKNVFNKSMKAAGALFKPKGMTKNSVFVASPKGCLRNAFFDLQFMNLERRSILENPWAP